MNIQLSVLMLLGLIGVPTGLHVERVCRAERRDRLVAVPESEGIPRWHCYEETAGGSPFRLVPRIRKF